MGNPVKSTPSVGDATHPTNAGSIPSGTSWGIDNLLTGCIVQSESITEEDITDDTQDQKGAMVSRLTYDKHYTLNLTILTSQIEGNWQLSASIADSGKVDFSYAGSNWFVNSITYNGSYNQKKSYTINAERWLHYPATQSNG